MSAPGRLLLVPVPLDFGCAEQAPLDAVLPARTLDETARLSHWICENAKSARAHLKRVAGVRTLAAPLQALHLAALPHAVHKQGDLKAPFDAGGLLAPALAGHDVGLMSECGLPAVADPGSAVVRAAHELGLTVVPLVGPSSLMLALMASGLNGQHFAFHGYLPQDATDRAARIRELEGPALRSGQTQIVIETPYRNEAVWQALVRQLQPHTRLAVCTGLTLPQARCLSLTVKTWKQRDCPLDGRTPAVFAFGR